MTAWSLDTAPDFYVEWTTKLRCNACGHLVAGLGFVQSCPEHGAPDLGTASRGRVTCTA